MLLSIEPLRNELAGLENEAAVMKKGVVATQALVESLQASIIKYKEEYGLLVSEEQVIKADLSTGTSKFP